MHSGLVIYHYNPYLVLLTDLMQGISFNPKNSSVEQQNGCKVLSLSRLNETTTLYNAPNYEP